MAVEHSTRTYRQETNPASGGVTLSVDPDDIRRWLSDRTLYGVSIVGTEQINGVNVLHLRVQTTSSADNADLWVDDASYEPVRVVRSKSGFTVQDDVEWLERTPQNLALLTLVPPAGYTLAP